MLNYILCSNESTNKWSTIGNYQVKFKKWYSKTHAIHSVIPSYGGWLRFIGVSLYSWNYKTFVQIEKACGGFLAVARETMELKNLIEAKVKVRYNYSGFVPTSLLITDDQGEGFIVYTVPPPEVDGLWK